MSIKEYLMKEEKDDIPREMTGAEIAKELGISRQAVSNTLKRAMKKVYIEAKKLENWSPFEAAVAISQMFGQDADLNKFFRLFPPDVRKEIEKDAREKFGGKIRK
jgi:DNA-binding transcriptional regulator LsrR (DeoR family)